MAQGISDQLYKQSTKTAGGSHACDHHSKPESAEGDS